MKYTPDVRIEALGPEFYDPVKAADVPETVLRYRNDRAAKSVGLDTLTNEAWISSFGRFEPLEDNLETPLALRYHGHQFQVYNPELGDGRGFLFAQMRDDRGRLLDLGTKGSGRTPYSRMGDGRLTLLGGVREVLAASYLEALGVNTSKSFSLIETGETLQRNDEPSPARSSVLVRLSHSHLRFGTFQRHAFDENRQGLKTLTEYCLEHFYPDAGGTPEALLAETLKASAATVAQWMAAGFVHGVMNTDNMNITGESFDYGPYRFLPALQPGFTAAYFDHNGLYAFARQPEIMYWNLAQLVNALSLIADDKPLITTLETYPAHYREALCDAVFKRLGITRSGTIEADVEFAGVTFRWLEKTQVPFAQFYRDFYGGAEALKSAKSGPGRTFYKGEGFDDWIKLLSKFKAAVQPNEAGEATTLIHSDIESLWDPIAGNDDWSLFDSKLAAIERLSR